MFERYDEPARRVIFFARYEAGAFGVAEILGEFGLSLEKVREDLAKRGRRGLMHGNTPSAVPAGYMDIRKLLI